MINFRNEQVNIQFVIQNKVENYIGIYCLYIILEIVCVASSVQARIIYNNSKYQQTKFWIKSPGGCEILSCM